MEHIAILEKSFDKLIQCKSLSILIKSILNKIFIAFEENGIYDFDKDLLLDVAKDICNNCKSKSNFVWELNIADTNIRLVFSKQYDDWFVSTHFNYWVEKVL